MARRGDPEDRYRGLRRLGDTAPATPAATAQPPAARRPRRTEDAKRSDHPQRRRRRRALAVATLLLVLLLVLLGGSLAYLSWRFGQVKRSSVAGLAPIVAGQPINVLVVGSDSRSGLTGALGAQAGVGQVTGERSDVVMVWHLDPGSSTASILSIPRDTMVSMGSLAAEHGRFNRINTALSAGAGTLAAIVSDNLGIPIHHVVQVDFSGFVGATDALGGVWMNFPYPARDAYSGLSITQSGCQRLDGTQALAVARSRHYEYLVDGRWASDPTSDFGRIHRQGAFLRALASAAKGQMNPLRVDAFLRAIPKGVTIDDRLGFLDALDLGWHYRGLDPGALATSTLPTTGASVSPWGDVLFVSQPAAQELLAATFGAQLTSPTTPPPDRSLSTPAPPTVTTPEPAPTGGSAAGGGSAPPVTTTTQPAFDPAPCSGR